MTPIIGMRAKEEQEHLEEMKSLRKRKERLHLEHMRSVNVSAALSQIYAEQSCSVGVSQLMKPSKLRSERGI